MRMPRDLSGVELAAMLRRRGYTLVRQRGSHLRLTSNFVGCEHRITVPRHNPLKVGTLDDILSNVALYLEMDQGELIQAIVDVMRPGPEAVICDPACGTGGFLLAAHDYISEHNPAMDQGQRAHLKDDALHG